MHDNFVRDIEMHQRQNDFCSHTEIFTRIFFNVQFEEAGLEVQLIGGESVGADNRMG